MDQRLTRKLQVTYASLNSWSPFAVVAELPPRATVVSYRSFPTDCYPKDAWGTTKPGAQWREHCVAVLWDEDRDERVLHVLAQLVYAEPRTASRISAIAEHKGTLSVWAAWIERADWLAINKAASSLQIEDSWVPEVHELVFAVPSIPGNQPHLTYVNHNLPADSQVPRLMQFDSDDELVLRINALYPLGWWGSPKPSRTPGLE